MTKQRKYNVSEFKHIFTDKRESKKKKDKRYLEININEDIKRPKY